MFSFSEDAVGNKKSYQDFYSLDCDSRSSWGIKVIKGFHNIGISQKQLKVLDECSTVVLYVYR